MQEEQRRDYILATFDLLMKNSQDMMFVKDNNLVYIAASDSFARVVGRAHGAEIIGKTDFEVFAPELARKYTEDDRGILDSGVSSINYLEPLPDKEGRKTCSATSKYVLRNACGQIIGLYGIARDVTAQVELEAERESSRLTRQMFDDVLEADLTENRMLRVEGSEWVHALAVSEESAFTETVATLTDRFIHRDFQKEFTTYYDLCALRTGYDNGVHEFNHLTLLDVPKRGFRWVECRSRIYHSRISDTLRITTFLKDTDDEVRSRQKLQQKALTDALTGLSNRESVFERVAASMSTDASICQALLFIDLDRFKQVNDRWGHLFGDKVLQNTAERLRDLFGREEICGRIGGDEFLVFLRHARSRQAVEAMAQRAVEQLSFYHAENQDEVYVTCSVGIALCDGRHSLEQIYAQADRAMYRAKESGRNRISFYEDL